MSHFSTNYALNNSICIQCYAPYSLHFQWSRICADILKISSEENVCSKKSQLQTPAGDPNTSASFVCMRNIVNTSTFLASLFFRRTAIPRKFLSGIALTRYTSLSKFSHFIKCWIYTFNSDISRRTCMQSMRAWLHAVQELHNLMCISLFGSGLINQIRSF